MNYEEQIRREMEAAAKQQQVIPLCPEDKDINASFGLPYKPTKLKRGAKKLSRRRKPL